MKRNFLMLGTLLLAVLVLTGCSGQNQAQEGNQNQEIAVGQNGSGKGGGPNDNGQAGLPEEAINACANLSEGDSCSFTMTINNGDEEEREGTCWANPKDETLTCMSGDMQGPGGPGGGDPNDIQK